VQRLLLAYDALDEFGRGRARAGLGSDRDGVAVDAGLASDLLDRGDDRLGERGGVDVAGSLACHRRFGDGDEEVVVEFLGERYVLDRFEGESGAS